MGSKVNCSYLGLGLFLLFLYLCGRPLHYPPEGFDAHSYIWMATEPIDSWGNLPHHHAQRILPSLIVKLTSYLFGPTTSGAFYLLSLISFTLFSAGLLYGLNRNFPNPLANLTMVILLLIQNWPLLYSIHNYYQLCDMWAILWSLGFLYCLKQENLKLFSLLAITGILIRQNLWVLIATSGLYFFIRHPQKRIHLLALGGALLLEVLGIISLIGMGKTLAHLSWLPQNVPFWGQKQLFVLTSPFIIVVLFYTKQSLSYAKKYWPFFLFMMVTIYQPYSKYDYTGPVNLERIIIQGLWPINYLGIFLFLKNITWHPLYYSFPLIYGTAHLSPYLSQTLGPLIFLPAHFKNQFIILLGLLILFQRIKKTSGT